MRTLIYTVYALTVLLFAGFARANTLMNVANGKTDGKFRSTVAITEVGFNQQAMSIAIGGRLPNPCYQDPTAVLVMDKHNANSLILRLVSPTPTVDCMAMIKRFETEVNLPLLAQAAELPLDDKALYVIRTEGYDFALEVSGQDLKRQN